MSSINWLTKSLPNIISFAYYAKLTLTKIGSLNEATSDNATTSALIAGSVQSLIELIIRYNLAIFTQ